MVMLPYNFTLKCCFGWQLPQFCNTAIVHLLKKTPCGENQVFNVMPTFIQIMNGLYIA